MLGGTVSSTYSLQGGPNKNSKQRLLSQLLSKVTVTACSQMFNVSALLLLLFFFKCVVTEVVLFSVVSFKTLTFHKVV